MESGGTNYPVVAVGSSAFNGKSWFKTLRMPDTIRSIGNSAFENCHALSSMEVPGSVTNIASYAFYECGVLKSVVFKSAEAPTVGGDAFGYVPADATFYIYEGSTGYDTTQYPWNRFSVVTLMDDGSVGQPGAINESVTWSAGVPYQILAPLKVRGSSTVLTIDANAPTAALTDDGEVFGARRWTLSFSKPVQASTVTAAALSLTRDGAPVAVPASAKLTQVSDTVWTVSGLDAALSADGAYVLSFDAALVRDLSGNAGAGDAATSAWSYSSAPPAAIADLAFVPDWGTNATDGVTWQREVTVTGSVPDGAYSIEILARDAADGESVLAETFYPTGEASFAQEVVLPIGRGTLVVRCANSSGKTSDNEKDFFIDAIPLSLAFAGFPEEGEGQLTNDVALVFSEPVTNVTAECFAIRRGARGAVEIPEGALAIMPDASNLVWTVSGLDALTTSGGIYTVTFDLSRVEKLSSGLHGEFDEEFVSFMETYGGVDPTTATAGDYLRAMTNETEKVGADGYRMTLLDEFVAGTDPADPDDVLYATISIEDGVVYVGWVPDLNADGKARRVYKVWGKREILESSWSAEPLSADEIDGGEYRFFRVTVQMPKSQDN